MDENYRGPLAGFEPDCILTPMHAGDRADGGAPQYALVSIAISLKRIADALAEGSPFLAALAGTLDDASHNHQQRMRDI